MRVRASSSPDSRAHSSRSRASSCGASPRASVVSICASSSEYCCARSIARVCTLARRSSRLSESQQSGCGQPSAPLPPPARHLLNATLEPAQCARRSDGASVGGIHHPAAGATASPTANSALNCESMSESCAPAADDRWEPGGRRCAPLRPIWCRRRAAQPPPRRCTPHHPLSDSVLISDLGGQPKWNPLQLYLDSFPIQA